MDIYSLLNIFNTRVSLSSKIILFLVMLILISPISFGLQILFIERNINYIIVLSSIMSLIITIKGITYILLGLKLHKFSNHVNGILNFISIVLILLGLSAVLAGLLTGIMPTLPYVYNLLPDKIIFPIYKLLMYSGPLLLISLFISLGITFIKKDNDLNKKVVN